MKNCVYIFILEKNSYCFDNRNLELQPSVGWASDSGSGHDLAVCEFEPRVRLATVSTEPALDPLSLSPPLCPSPAHAFSKIRNIKKKKIKKKKIVAGTFDFSPVPSSFLAEGGLILFPWQHSQTMNHNWFKCDMTPSI